MKKLLISLMNKLPYVRGLYKENLNFKKNACYPPGHFYSPIVSVDELRSREKEIWKETATESIEGVDFNTTAQLEWLARLEEFYGEMPFTDEAKDGLRYYFKNNYYSYTDGIVLYGMMRCIKPKRIIEIGSGYSSAVMLDTNHLFFNDSIDLSFVEPYPDRLNSLLTSEDHNRSKLYQQNVQTIPIDVFEELEEGDFLFVDSSHVAKTGSDVNHLIFEILPKLASGVVVHFHDVFYPFEYPKKWVFQGRNWNEDYFLRAFLMYNNEFEILVFSDYLHKFHKESFKNMPLTYKNAGGNLWLRKK